MRCDTNNIGIVFIQVSNPIKQLFVVARRGLIILLNLKLAPAFGVSRVWHLTGHL